MRERDGITSCGWPGGALWRCHLDARMLEPFHCLLAVLRGRMFYKSYRIN